MTEKEVLKFINALRKADEYMEDIFTMGSCYRFYLLLKKLYPDAEPMINKDKDHVATKIGRKLYDIRGVVKNSDGRFIRLTGTDLAKAKKWSFRKQCLLQVTECPACEEPIVYSTKN